MGAGAINLCVFAAQMCLIGFRQQAYREKAVQALHLRPGDTVVDVGCGTGLNFSLLQSAIVFAWGTLASEASIHRPIGCLAMSAVFIPVAALAVLYAVRGISGQFQAPETKC